MHFHCWHIDGSSRRKIESKSRCKLKQNLYITKRGYVNYLVDEYCCICGKRRALNCKGYSIGRALEYPSNQEYMINKER